MHGSAAPTQHDRSRIVGRLMVPGVPSSEYPRGRVTALVLAGGEGRRMGGRDKGLVDFRGEALVDHVLGRVAGQAGACLVSANRHLAEYALRGWPVLTDPPELPPAAGPLAGIVAGLAAARGDWLLVVPCDAPFLPLDLGPRLYARAQAGRAEVAIAEVDGRPQPVCALLSVEVLGPLTSWLVAGGRKVLDWYALRRTVRVAFDDPAAFRNLNAPEDLDAA